MQTHSKAQIKTSLATLLNQSHDPEVLACVADDKVLDMLSQQIVFVNELSSPPVETASTDNNDRTTDGINLLVNHGWSQIDFIRSAYTPSGITPAAVTTHIAITILDVAGVASQNDHLKCAAAAAGLANSYGLVKFGAVTCKATLGAGCVLSAAVLIHQSYQVATSCGYL